VLKFLYTADRMGVQMLDLMHMYRDRIIKQPADNPILHQIYSIDGMPELIQQCYPNFGAFVDCDFQSRHDGVPCIKIILPNVPFPVDFMNANGISDTCLWQVKLETRQPIQNVRIGDTKTKTNPIVLRIITPSVADNVSSGISVLLERATRIGNNCHFGALDARGVQQIGDTFSAQRLVAPQLTTVGNDFNVSDLDAPMLNHPKNIAALDDKIHAHDARIASMMQQIQDLEKSVADIKRAREKLVRQRAMYQSQSR